MAKPRVKLRSKRFERLRIKKGNLGPIGAPCEIVVRPLTVLIGRQGTGKSLIAQLLYLFRGLPGLVDFALATAADDEAREPKRIIRRIVDGLRSSQRSFANLTRPNVSIEWKGRLVTGRSAIEQYTLGFNAQHVTRQIQPGVSFQSLVESLSSKKRRPRPLTALFVPTERLLYAHVRSAASLQVIRAPLILEVFTHWMDIAGSIQDDWENGPDTPDGRWVREHLRSQLGGEAHRKGSKWRWSFGHGKNRGEIDLDMASSGQRANWPLQLLPQVLFSMRSRNEIAEDFTLYVEEPEIHLHPAAERAVIEALVFLVTRGFRVVMTTHSLTALYTINNLMMASRVTERDLAREHIPSQLRLEPRHVAAYHLIDGKVEGLHDDETGLLDEHALGAVSDDLAAQMNRLHLLRSKDEVDE